MEIKSSAFEANEPIPKQYSREGRDVSPPLEWTDPPDGTMELALIVDDPDAPRPKPWVHWVLYKIPATERGVAEGQDAGGIEGPNDFGESGWGGPLPPPGHGVHHYRFRLYALSKPLVVDAGATKDELRSAMKG